MDNLYYTELFNVYKMLEKQAVDTFDLPRTDLAAFARFSILARFARELMTEAEAYKCNYSRIYEEELAHKFEALKCGTRGLYKDIEGALKMRADAIKAGLQVTVLAS